MTVQVQLDLQIGSKFYAEITCDEDQTGRTHRAQIRTAVSTITTKMDLVTGAGITIHSTNPKILILEKGATATEAIVCPTDSALWVFDCESLGATADDKVREAEGPVYVTRDVTRSSEATADADASKLFTYSLDDGQTLTTEEQENARDKLGITGGATDAVLYTAQTLTSPQQIQALTNQGVTAAGQAVARAADAAAQRTAMGAEASANKGIAGGYASLDGTGQIPQAQIPAIAITEKLADAASEAAMLALTGQVGDWTIRTDTGLSWIITGNDPTQLSSWTALSYPGAPVTSVAGRTGAVTLSTGDVSGLGDSASRNVGTTAGTVAAGDDTRFSRLQIGWTVTSSTASRILTTDASGNLAQQGELYFDALAFGAGMTSRQTFRNSLASSGFLASIDGGWLLGRANHGPCLFVGNFTITGPVIPLGGALGFGNNNNDYRVLDARIERHAADVVKGAALRMRDYTVAGLPSAATFIYCEVMCTNEAGGAVPVFSDGTNWRRVTDRAIAS